MAVNDIVDKILEEAANEASDIKKEAKALADQILAAARQEASIKKKEYLDKFNQQIEQRVRKIITNANLEAKKIVLNAKSDVIDEVFKIATDGLDKNKLPKKTVILKDARKIESIDPKEFMEQVKLQLAPEVASILNME